MWTGGLGQMNENGVRFADLCFFNQLVIGKSIFSHKCIQQGHLEICGLHQPNIHEIMAGCASDEIFFGEHKNARKIFNMGLLFQSKEKKAILNTSRTRTTKVKTQEVDLFWYHQENREQERKESYTEHEPKVKTQEEYTAADRDVKKSVKENKKDYIEELACQVEHAVGQGNLKDLYLTTIKLAGKFQQTSQLKARTSTHWHGPRNSWRDGQNTTGSC